MSNDSVSVSNAPLAAMFTANNAPMLIAYVAPCVIGLAALIALVYWAYKAID
jgi:hypothetical protein